MNDLLTREPATKYGAAELKGGKKQGEEEISTSSARVVFGHIEVTDSHRGLLERDPASTET